MHLFSRRTSLWPHQTGDDSDTHSIFTSAPGMSQTCAEIKFFNCRWRRVRCHLWHIFRLMMCQMFSIGERSGLQAGQFSTRTLLLRSFAVVVAAECGFALSCWNTRRLEGSIFYSKIIIYLSAFIGLSKICKLPISYILMHPHTFRDAGFWTACW